MPPPLRPFRTPLYHHALHLVAGLATLVGLHACARSGAHASAAADHATSATLEEKAPPNATLSGVSEHDGQVLVEFPLGEHAGMSPGMLLRAYREDGGQRTMIGMLQITEVLGADRSVARQIGLSDKGKPLAIGDHVRLLSDLSADGQELRNTLAGERKKQDAGVQADEDRFAALRADFQRQLTQQQQAHEQVLSERERRHATDLDALKAEHQRAWAVKDIEYSANLAALKTAMTDDARNALITDRKQRDDKLREVAAERERLRTQVDALIAEQTRFQATITQLNQDASTRERLHREQLRAEVETREVLTAKLAELEHRIGGITQPVTPVLTNDPGRKETVLERLNRLSDDLHARDAALADKTKEAEAAQITLTQARGEAQRLHDAEDQRVRLAEELTAAKRDLADSQSQRDAHELARLQAERTLYDLSSRVLRLASADAELTTLQTRLRATVATVSSDAKPSEATP